MFPVIVCIAKKEHDYIEEFVKYHLALGFTHIYLYDNEDVPIYEKMLDKYNQYMTVIHIPHNNYHKGVQYVALDHFKTYYMFNDTITHIAHIDIDEFIVLKKHKNICDFINEYIVGDCQGIGMNWRFFGSSGLTEKNNEPLTIRFTMCQKDGKGYGNELIKTLFKKDNFTNYNTCHDVQLSGGYIKSTTGSHIDGPFNHDINYDVIQLNHYKCKTLPEFRYIRTRLRADVPPGEAANEDVDGNFKLFDMNEVEDLTASNFYKNVLASETT